MKMDGSFYFSHGGMAHERLWYNINNFRTLGYLTSRLLLCMVLYNELKPLILGVSGFLSMHKWHKQG